MRALPLVGCNAAHGRCSPDTSRTIVDDPNHRFLSAHLAHCGRCRRILATLTAVIDNLRTLPADQVPPSGSLAGAVAQRLADDSHAP